MWDSIEKFTNDVFESVLLLLVDFVCAVLEGLLNIAKAAMDGLFSSIDTSMLTEAMGNVPGQMLHVALMVGVGEAVGVILTALSIRFILQLIPLLRLGS
ncbi:DUF2523 domain-containing protein [Brucella sp. 10RB9212]|uniref:DUF2523 family protein n=1 Tax=unclassified Brucella TaxID=2632610 RepID=UPI00097270CB|nr:MULTISPECIES: DUF2523 family protein [unclassified Brucella]APY15759.1 hypothetical protein BKD02_15950 [Brucella sp. 09RB8910]MRN45390.1 DUF2523 domain-containing protein [Brucella sp. 10RB9212]